MESNDNGQNPTNQSSTLTLNQALKVDDTVDAEVTRITEYGAFVKLAGGKKGLIHISQVADSYVKNVNDHLKVGDKVKARVITISPDGKIDLTLKTQKEPAPRPRGERRQFDNGRRENSSSYPNNKPFKTSAFEEKLKSFLQESEERQSDLKKHIEEKQGKH
jgi:S1 RNA binding domain protein